MSVFSGLADGRVIEEPFPHVVFDPAIDPELSRTLLEELPAIDVLSRGAPPASNARFSLPAADALRSPSVSAAWRAAISACLAQPFLDDLLTLFGPSIRRELPHFEAHFGRLDALRSVLRYTPEHVAGTVGMDGQISVNTPALVGGTTVKGPHVDLPDKLFVGLLYFRHPEDRSEGADLELYEALPGAAFDAERMVPRERVRTVATIPYRHNRLVLFLNTPRSLHGVTPRAATPYPRYFLNIVALMNSNIFELAGRDCGEAAQQFTTRRPRILERIAGWWRSMAL